MYRCPCGFATSSKHTFQHHVRGCTKAKERVLFDNSLSDVVEDVSCFLVGVAAGSLLDSIFDNSDSSGNSGGFDGGGGDFGGGGVTGDWE